MTTTDYDDGKAGGSGMGRVMIVTHSDKRQARPPTDHFKRHLEEVYPNHAYPVRHKLKDDDMIKSFMTSGSLNRGTELDEDLSGSDTLPFPREDVVMTVGLVTVGDTGTQGCKGINFPTALYICEYVYYSRSKRRKKERAKDS
jgi:hypothetical protein